MFKIAWRFLRTDWRSGELRLLFMSLLLAVTIVTGLTAFVERLQLMLAGESSQFLAADRVLKSPQPVNPLWLDKASGLNLQQAALINFQSMFYASVDVDAEPVLVSIKAAGENYPLIGELKTRPQPYGEITAVKSGPAVGEVWAESRLLQQMNIDIGAQVYIGDAQLKLTKVLVSEPDRGAGFISMGPRVLMHLQDVAASNVISEGSRVSYSWLFAGDKKAIDLYWQWLKPQLTDREKWLDLENSQPTVAVALQRAKTFFVLASSMIIVLAVIAIAMSSTRYSQRHIKHIAVLKTLGATSTDIKRLYTYLLLLLFIAVVCIGWLLGFLLQQLVLMQAAAVLDVALPPLSLWPFLLGAATALISLMTFTLPVIDKLRSIPAVRIFQQASSQELKLSLTSAVIGLAGVLLLLSLYTGQILLSVLMLLSLTFLLAVVVFPARLLLTFIPAKGLKARNWWSMAVANMQRRLWVNALQISLFSISLMLLLVLIGLRDNLFSQWQEQLPAETPNFFLVNLQQPDVASVEQWLQNHAAKQETIYPMIRGRLVRINDKLVRERVSKEDFKRSGADRELNLSWADSLPPDNTLTAGSWHDADASSASNPTWVSVESKLAKKLEIKLGDSLTFMIAAQTLTAKVSSLREVEWDRMRPNFYMLLPKQSLQMFPKTYMTSFYLPASKHKDIVNLLKIIPTAIVIEIDSMIKQIRHVIHHVSLALQLVLFFVFIGVILVMFATVQISLDSRKKENTVIRALGGTKKLIIGSLITEFMLLGLLAGILATFAAELVLLALQKWLMDLPLQLHPELWYLAPLLGLSIVGSAGFLAARKVTAVVPMQLLREN
ncbi:MAG: FtsX-like permease family protein [Pseudomonadales bacterium]|nr:FtsX-like permease family protein [Pseudomonadales bacterium]